MLRAFYAQVRPGTEPDFSREQLSDYRLERLERTKLLRSRALSLGVELLLIRALKTLEEPRLPLEIYVRPGGKPRLREGPCFSLSHSVQLRLHPGPITVRTGVELFQNALLHLCQGPQRDQERTVHRALEP